MPEHETKLKFRNEINENTKLPLRVVAAVVLFAVGIVAGWYDLRSEMNRRFDKLEAEIGDSVSQKQVRDWIDDARDANAGKGVTFPRLPEKNTKIESPEPLAVVEKNQFK